MLLLAWFTVPAALAGPPSFDATTVCAAEDKVVLAPGVRRRLGVRNPCPAVISDQAVSDYMRAFAVLSRELKDPVTAGPMVEHMEARWLVVGEGRGYTLYDAEDEGFVDPSVFLAEAAGEPLTEAQKAALDAYRLGYRALRAKKTDDAERHLTTCLEHDPTHVGCHWELGWVHWVAEDWAAAAASWTRVEEHAPDHPELDQWLPKARAKAGDDAGD